MGSYMTTVRHLLAGSIRLGYNWAMAEGRRGGGEGQRQAEVRTQEEPGRDGQVADQGQPGAHHQGR